MISAIVIIMMMELYSYEVHYIKVYDNPITMFIIIHYYNINKSNSDKC